MRAFNRTVLTLLSAAILAGCNLMGQASTPVPHGANPFIAQPNDSFMTRADIRVDSASVKLAESNPPQVMLHFAYFQPTPCFSLRVQTSQPDAQNRINVSAYAVAEKDKPCALMALSTPLQADLNLGSFPKGTYSVWLNGAKVRDVEL